MHSAHVTAACKLSVTLFPDLLSSYFPTGCDVLGVCGKTPEVANMQDLLVHALKGICAYAYVISRIFLLCALHAVRQDWIVASVSARALFQQS